MLGEIWNRIKYWRQEDRISPENPLTHWKLYFRSSMSKLGRKKFKHFGENAEIRPHSFIGGCSNISIGKNVVIRPGSMLLTNSSSEFNGLGSITIEDNVLFGPDVKMFTGKHRFSDPATSIIDQGLENPRNILIKEGSWIGAGVIILPGVTVGSNSVVGSGSVVNKDVPDNVLVVGVPAKMVRDLRGEGLNRSTD